MWRHALSSGANAVIAMRFDRDEIAGDNERSDGVRNRRPDQARAVSGWSQVSGSRCRKNR
ncbi:hypothetical protein [Nocardia asiatica]|uniref:hypothetical protein n=1 Tax=Nocardia asiatica TaxID=209252 RepID=UPI003EE30D11